MNVVDWIVLAYLAIGLLNGWRRGLLSLVIIIAGYAVAYLVARQFYVPLATLADARILPTMLRTPMGSVAAKLAPGAVQAIAFLFILFVVDIVVGLIAAPFVGANRIPVVGSLNRAGGALLGLAEHGFIVVVLLNVVVAVLGGSLGPVKTLVQHSAMYTALLGKWKLPFLTP